jgi:hypothetical protein
MKKNLLIAFWLLYAGMEMVAQRARVVYTEVAGSALGYSANFDVRFKKQPDGWGARLGASLIDVYCITPVQINHVSGGKHGVEVGAGFTAFIYAIYKYEGPENEIWPSATIMYRFQGKNGLNIRAGWTPIFNNFNNSYLTETPMLWIWPGASIGYQF